MLDFLICYEHINREAENDALIKHELLRRGYSCEIMHFNGPGFFKHSLYQKARVVVAPWLRYDDNVYHYLRMAKKPYKIVNLQWEQVYSDEDLRSGIVTVSGQALKARHICWGENSKQRLIEQGVEEKNLVVTGAIQMDYGRTLFQNYYHDRNTLAGMFKLDPTKKWILMVSSFAYVNYGNAAIKQIEEQFCCSLKEQVQLHLQSQALFLDWAESLMRHMECEFIYRPHPSENTTQRLADMQQKYKQFHVISSCSVKQWAKVCDKTNLWISTSNAEISAVGADYAILRPIPIPHNIEVESMRAESFITDCDSFIEYNAGMLDASFTPKERIRRLSQFYSYDDSCPAYIKITDYLIQVLNDPQKTEYSFPLSKRLSFGLKEVKKLVISFIMEFCRKHPTSQVIDKMPLKPIIKANLKKGLARCEQAKQTEETVMMYMDKV